MTHISFVHFLIDFIMSSHDHYTKTNKKMSLEDATANLEIDLSEKITNLTTEVR